MTDVPPPRSTSDHQRGQLLLDVRDLSIGFGSKAQTEPVVKSASFQIRRGGVLALIGESGSGKTLAARSVMGLLPKGAQIVEGSIKFDGEEITSLDPPAMRRLRGARIGMILQEPMVSLNPALTIEKQVCEGLRLHRGLDRQQARQEAISMLQRVGISDPEARLKQYPHEFSGGMRQRIMIASTMLLKPDLVIADEPTTALDAIIQADVMKLILELTNEIGAAVLLITHDLGVVADYANEVAIMRRGEIVERGEAATTLARPQHDYTRSLLESLPTSPPTDVDIRGDRPVLAAFEDVKIRFPLPRPWPWMPQQYFEAVKGVSLEISKGEAVAIVGESGSGKSTLGKALLGLLNPSAGRIMFDGTCINERFRRPFNHQHARIQLIFQDPYSSLNPRLRVGEIVAEALRHLELQKAEISERTERTLFECGLGPEFLDRFPHQLSGGQRQRVCIARALACDPDLVVADEPVAALDLTIQAQVLKLLRKLQDSRGFSLLFISHDLSVVQQIADRVAVMRRGRVVEIAPTASLYANARHPYTHRLLKASPYLEADAEDGSYRLLTRTTPDVNLPPDAVGFADDEDAESDPEKRVMSAVGPMHFVAVQQS